MKEPARWRAANGGASADVQALLRSDRLEAPTDAEKQRIWSSLAPELGTMPAPPPAGPVATAGTGGLAVKLTVVVLAVAAGTGVGWYGLHALDARRAQRAATARATSTAPPAASRLASPEMPSPGPEGPPPTMPAPAAESAPGHRPLPVRHERLGGDSEARRAAGSEARPAPATRERPSRGEVEEPAAERPLASSWGRSPWPTPAPAAADQAPAKGSASRAPAPAQPAPNELLEESRLLAAARAALRAHDPDRALTLLAGAARGTATLAQEREVLTIEALAARPATRPAAVERARALLRAYPQSPYRARIKAMVSQSP